MRVTVAQLAALQAKGAIKVAGELPPVEKGSKYSNRKTEVDGITFDSAKEARRYQELKLLERAGQISDLRLQVPFELVPAVELYGKKRKARHYVADFVYLEGGETVVEDAKGMRTDMYLWKRQMMKAVHGIEIRET